MKYYIYKHTNLINNKVYIGQTHQDPPEKRWKNGKGYKHSYFAQAIEKYGWENFQHEIITVVDSLEEANKIEAELIQQYDARNRDKGYNIAEGGTAGGYSHTQESKIKNKIAQGKLWENEQYRQKQGQAISKGLTQFYKKNEDIHKQLSHSQKLRYAEGRNKLQELNEQSKKSVVCIETNQLFGSLKEAADWANLKSISGIAKVCNNLPKYKTAGGYHWRWA